VTTDDELRRMWRKRYTSLLDMVFKEYKSVGLFVTPDEAMDVMEELLPALVSEDKGSEPEGGGHVFRFDFAAFRSDAHHYAVDLFYKTYYGLRGKGRPPLPREHLDQLLGLRRQGLSYRQIGKKLGQTQDATRKQVKVLERLWEEKRRELYKLAAKLNLAVAVSNHDTDPQ